MLRDRALLLLLVATAVTGFGDTVLYLALGIWVKDLTGSSALAGAVFFALGLAALAGPLLGWVVDQMSRKTALVAVNLVMGVVVTSLFLVHDAGDVWLVYVVAVLYGGALNLVSASRSALLRDMVEDSRLATVNSALQTIAQVLRLLSPLFGAGLYTVFGGHGLVALDVATFVVAVVVLSAVRVTESARGGDPGEETFLRQVTSGLRYIRGRADLRNVTAGVAAVMAVLGFFESVLFVVVDALGQPTSFYGVLLTVQGAGAVAGGLTAAALQRRMGQTVLVAVGIALVGFSVAGMLIGEVLAVAGSALLMGAGLSWYAAAFASVLQMGTPPRLQGRVTASAYCTVDLPLTLSIAAGAVLIGFVHWRVVMAVMAVVCLAVAVWIRWRGRDGHPSGADQVRVVGAVRLRSRRVR